MVGLARFALCTMTFLACGGGNESAVQAPGVNEASANDSTSGNGANQDSAEVGDVSVDVFGGSDALASIDAASTQVHADAQAEAQTEAQAEAQAEGGPPPDRGWDWNGVVGTGQSLSVGAQASAATLTTQPFHNLKLSLGTASITTPPYNANDPALSVVPLVEPIRAEATGYPSAYPLNIYGETPHTAMADEISALYQKDTGSDYVTIHTVVGESGQGLSVIDKTATVTPNMGHAYAATLFEVSAIKRLATAAGKTYGVGGIILTHGETDAGNNNYESGMYQLYTDYNADISAITGQTKKIPLFVTQQQTSPSNNTTTASLIAEWKIGADHPGDVVCVGPKYQYPYAADHLHLVASGYDQLGEKYAEVYYEKVVLSHDWQPLQPASVSRVGAVITVHFHVPVPPLAWDTGVPAPHQTVHPGWANGRGFEVSNQASEQAINSVMIQGDSVVIALAAVPVAAGLVVRYAVTEDGNVAGGSFGGLASGRVGQLRDSDSLVGYATKLPQYNYAVSFVLPVN